MALGRVWGRIPGLTYSFKTSRETMSRFSANTSIVKRGILSYFEDDGYGLVYIFDLGNKLRALEFWSHSCSDDSRIIFYFE
jgi:hypothetical protein